MRELGGGEEALDRDAIVKVGAGRNAVPDGAQEAILALGVRAHEPHGHVQSGGASKRCTVSTSGRAARAIHRPSIVDFR
jgi:hypothetical protein